MTEWTFRLTLRGIELTDDQLDALHEAGCDDGSFSASIHRLIVGDRFFALVIVLLFRGVNGLPLTVLRLCPDCGVVGRCGVGRGGCRGVLGVEVKPRGRVGRGGWPRTGR